MRFKSLPLVLILITWLGGCVFAGADEIDRLLAAVNGRVITEGDLKMARSLYALYHLGKMEASQSQGQELNALIDLELIRQEMQNFPIGQADESSLQAAVQAKMADLKSAYAEIGGLPALLSQLGLQESELLAYLRLRALMERFMNLRFRPFITATDTGNVEEKVNAAMDQWIENIRNHSRIEFFPTGTQTSEGKHP